MRSPRLMIAVAVLAVFGTAAWELSGARALRRRYLYQAADNRTREAWLREAAGLDLDQPRTTKFLGVGQPCPTIGCPARYGGRSR